MKRDSPEMKWSLTRYATVIFSSFLLITASLLLFVSYHRMSVMAYDSASQNFERSAQQIHDSVGNSYNRIVNMFGFLSSSVAWSELDHQNPDLNQYLDIVRYLETDTLTNSIYFGYENGSLLAFHLVETNRRRDYFSTPKGVKFVVDVIDPRTGRINRLQRIFFDKDYQQVGPILIERSSFNIFPRPWYQLGLESKNLSLVPLYKDVSNETNVITLVQKHAINNTVIAADIDIESLNQSFRVSELGDDTLKILFDQQSRFLIQNIFSTTSNAQLDDAEVMNASFEGKKLKNILQDNLFSDRIFTFKFRDKTWFGRIKSIKLFQDTPTELLIAAPQSTILSPARSILKENMGYLILIVLGVLPLCLLFARQLTKPLLQLSAQIRRVGSLDIATISPSKSHIKELNELQDSVALMSQTLNDFLHLLTTLSNEQDIKSLLEKTCIKSSDILQSSSAFAYLTTEQGEQLTPEIFHAAKSLLKPKRSALPTLSELNSALFDHMSNLKNNEFILAPEEIKAALTKANIHTDEDQIHLLLIPLLSKKNKLQGIIGFSYEGSLPPRHLTNVMNVAKALSEFIQLSFERHKSAEKQSHLLNSFIELIAGTIDTKSPYTGAHCQRVPELTSMLAREVNNAKHGTLSTVHFSKTELEQLNIAAWLHDCGKVTMPDHLIDKSTKLESVYNRIHEIRTRFEVLIRDAKIKKLTDINQGMSEPQANAELTQTLFELESDFAFIARCNSGYYKMNEKAEQRIKQIASRTWFRHLDDSLGLSETELSNKARRKVKLPVQEFVLSDKVEHEIPHGKSNDHDLEYKAFKMAKPALKNNLGELHNLFVTEGTINPEERYTIDKHVIETINMLEQLPFPRHLERVSEIAGAHHEQLNGTGYPNNKTANEISFESRILTVADIFESLTAKDRPYRKANTLSESIAILAEKADKNEIDKNLFKLFLASGIHLRYAKKYLSPEQIDEVDITQYLYSKGASNSAIKKKAENVSW